MDGGAGKKRKKVNITIHSHILNCTGSKRGCPCRAPLEHKPQHTLRKSWPTMKSMKMALSGTSEPQMCRLASDACNMTTLVLKSFVRQLWVLQVLRTCQFLTILTSKSFSRAGVVQILPTSTSKSAPNLSVFNDFDFQIVLARRRRANFSDFNFHKCSEPVSF